MNNYRRLKFLAVWLHAIEAVNFGADCNNFITAISIISFTVTFQKFFVVSPKALSEHFSDRQFDKLFDKKPPHWDKKALE